MPQTPPGKHVYPSDPSWKNFLDPRMMLTKFERVKYDKLKKHHLKILWMYKSLLSVIHVMPNLQPCEISKTKFKLKCSLLQ